MTNWLWQLRIIFFSNTFDHLLKSDCSKTKNNKNKHVLLWKSIAYHENVKTLKALAFITINAVP